MNRIQPVHYQTNKVGSFEDYGCHAGREYLFLLNFLGSIRTGAGAQAQALRADKSLMSSSNLWSRVD